MLGAFGGPRLDHALANVWLLAHPALDGVDVVLLDATTRASRSIRGPGDGASAAGAGRARTVSLLPLGGDAEGITTARAPLPAARRAAARRPGPRPVERPRRDADASVTLRAGRLLVLEIAPDASAGLDSTP